MHWYLLRLIDRTGKMLSHLTCANTPTEARERMEDEGFTVYSIRDCEIGRFVYLAPMTTFHPSQVVKPVGCGCSSVDPMSDSMHPEVF